jgi:hypothetical protein
MWVPIGRGGRADIEVNGRPRWRTRISAPVPRRLQQPVKTYLCPHMILLASFF